MLIYALLAAGAAGTPVSIYGIQIGAPLSVAECRLKPVDPKQAKRDAMEAERWARRGLTRYENPFPEYEHPTTGPCYKRLSKKILGTPVGTEKVHVDFPYGERLAGNDGYGVALQMIEGRVAYLRFNTRGRNWEQEDLATFTAKFGTPAKVEPIHLQNGFGAKFEALKATWRPAPGVTATYASWADDKYGDFGVGTEAGEKLFWTIVSPLPTRAL